MADPQTQTTVSSPAAPRAGLVPRPVLFGNPERVSPRISPDGTRLAWIAPDQGVLNVWVQDLGADADPARAVTSDRDRGVRVFFWAPDDARILYLQDRGGDENWRLYDVDLGTDENRDLTPYDKVQVQVTGVDLDIPERILVGMNKDDERLHDVYELALASGELTKVVSNPGFVGWTVDTRLRVRAAMAPRPDGGMTLMARDDAEGEWRPLLEIGQSDSLSTQPVGFDADGGRLLMISSVDTNAARLLWLDVASGAVEVIAEDGGYDVADAWLERRTRRPLMVAFQRERLEWQVLDQSVAADLAALQALDDGDLTMLGRTRDDATWVVAYDHADGPARFYRYDRASRTGTFLFENRPELGAHTLSPMEPFSFTSRDGLTIHGYLTFPAGTGRDSGLPTVLNVHGGPWGRDRWGFHSEAQWLANRGYLCVQVNFRGSTGYGKDFVNAGDREWGAKMHDDLVDAVAHVVGQGYADPKRVAIYGGSYGGYAALVGATFTPDVFACAVDIVGPSNLATLIASIPPYWEPLIAEFHTRVGNPETEPEFMWSRSPLSKVDAIRIPLLVAQGANDPRVKVAEAEQIVAALTEKGIPHEYLLFPDEGHGFAKPENRLRFYSAAERFLAEHLGGRYQD
jgi:dipeptidyl aminopeptidase/acylaminoacyl peptidase